MFKEKHCTDLFFNVFKATEKYRVAKFLAALEEIGGLHDLND
jgi:hypothetical protein